MIDEVRIWSSVLTSAQLGDLIPPVVNISFPPPDGLVDWFVHSPVLGAITATDPSYVTEIEVNGATSNVTGLGTTTATGTLTVSAEGINNIITTAIDGVDNSGAGPGSVNTAQVKIDTMPPIVTPYAAPTYILNQPGETVSATVTDATSGPAASPVSAPAPTGTVGSQTVPVTGFDVAGNSATVDCLYNVQYAPATTTSWGQPTRTILRPINVDGSSVFKQGSTVPAKFRVADINGNSIGTPGVVTDFKLFKIIAGTDVLVQNEPALSTTPDTAFRWSASDEQWIFNISTKNLAKNKTYVYQITLNDGTWIDFKFGLK